MFLKKPSLLKILKLFSGSKVKMLADVNCSKKLVLKSLGDDSKFYSHYTICGHGEDGNHFQELCENVFLFDPL